MKHWGWNEVWLYVVPFVLTAILVIWINIWLFIRALPWLMLKWWPQGPGY